MIHILWGAMIIIGIVYGILFGNGDVLGTAAINASKEAVELAVVMLGVMAMWTGLMQVAKECGLMDTMTKILRKPVKWIFPKVPEGHPAEEAIISNIVANILGLGWAATPAGLKAMKHLRELQIEEAEKKGKPIPDYASNAMCTFLIINISSLQLIPVNIIAYRSQYGAVNPAAIVGISILVTFCSTVVGVIYAKVKDKVSKE